MAELNSEQATAPAEGPYRSFAEFYPFYLGEHSNPTCRLLHVIGTSIVIALTVALIVTGDWRILPLLPLVGYGFAWVGHFFFEHNKPATFKQPIYSLIGDYVMFFQVITGKLPLR